MSTVFPNQVIIGATPPDTTAIVNYLGWGAPEPGTIPEDSTGPRIGCVSVSPTVGVAATLGTIAIQYTAGQVQLWQKTGAADTAWTALNSGIPATGMRPYDDPSQAINVTVYINNVTGSDTTGDGSSIHPFASISHAIRLWPEIIPANVGRTIQLQTTGVAYDCPLQILMLPYCTIQGALATITGAPGTVPSAVVIDHTTVTGGTIFDADHAGTNDLFRGDIIAWNGNVTAGLAGQYGVIGQNTNANARIWVSTDNVDVQVAPAAGDTFKTQKPAVTLKLKADLTIMSCVGLSFKELILDGDVASQFSYFVGPGQNINFTRCQMVNHTYIDVGMGSSITPICSYIAGFGVGFNGWGQILIRTGGFVQWGQGSMLDGVNGSANAYIRVLPGASIYRQGQAYFRDCSATYGGYYVTGGSIDGWYGSQANYGGAAPNFVDFWAEQGGPALRCNTGVDGSGGEVFLPRQEQFGSNIHGITAGVICFAGKAGAHVYLAGGVLAGSSGALAVSADDGVTQVATGVDGTTFRGGVPNYGSGLNPATGTAIPAVADIASYEFAIGAGAETNTVAAPTRPNQRMQLSVTSIGGGTRAVTFTGNALNKAGKTIITFAAAGDSAEVVSMLVGGVPLWRVSFLDGATLS